MSHTLAATLRSDRRLAILLAGFVLQHPGHSAAQPAAPEPSAYPLPSVVYPSREPATGSADQAPPGVAEEPAPATVDGEPVRYVLVNGVWGYWDRDRHFHPRLESSDRAPERRPGETGAIHVETDLHRTLIPRVDTPGRFVPRIAARPWEANLPNSAPRGIIVQTPDPRERSSGR